MKFTFITVCAPAVQHLARLHELYQRKNPGLAEIKLYYAVEEYAPKKMEQMAADIASADCVLVDLMGSPPASSRQWNVRSPTARDRFFPMAHPPGPICGLVSLLLRV